jgi:hypothetical protein
MAYDCIEPSNLVFSLGGKVRQAFPDHFQFTFCVDARPKRYHSGSHQGFRSGVNGASRSRTPVAAKMALLLASKITVVLRSPASLIYS